MKTRGTRALLRGLTTQVAFDRGIRTTRRLFAGMYGNPPVYSRPPMQGRAVIAPSGTQVFWCSYLPRDSQNLPR